MKTKFKNGRNCKLKVRGVASVEFAIVISLLVLITGGIIEFGRVMWYLDALTKATRDGARYLSTAAKPLSADDMSKARYIVERAAGTEAGAGLPGVGSANVAISCEPVTSPSCAAPDYVTVTITGYSIAFGSWFPMPLPAGDWPLTPHTTMRYMCSESGAPC